MKSSVIFIILVFSISASAQNIVVNGTNVNVSLDISFPYWLDSMATIEVGSGVVSISALEFNIVPTTNGNSLVFSQTKIITTQEIVPNGKTWKVEGVLLDSTTTSTTTDVGITTIEGSGAKAIALSEQSTNTMNMGDAMLYCDSLVEGGYDNWVVPTLEEIMFVAGGGGDVPGTRTSDYLWSTSYEFDGSNNGGISFNYIVRLNDGNHLLSLGASYSYLSNGNMGVSTYNRNNIVRCVRHASATSSNSNNTNSPTSTQLSNFPSMISAESATIMDFAGAVSYCINLTEGGFNDWVVPSVDELMYALTGGLDASIESNNLWTRSQYVTNGAMLTVITPDFAFWGQMYNDIIGAVRCVR